MEKSLIGALEVIHDNGQYSMISTSTAGRGGVLKTVNETISSIPNNNIIGSGWRKIRINNGLNGMRCRK